MHDDDTDAGQPDLARVAAPLDSNRCGAGHYYHNPAWLHPTADPARRRATSDNWQANLPRRSRWHDKPAFMTKAYHARLRRTERHTFEQRIVCCKSWDAGLIFHRCT
jgi:hypothetical protein